MNNVAKQSASSLRSPSVKTLTIPGQTLRPASLGPNTNDKRLRLNQSALSTVDLARSQRTAGKFLFGIQRASKVRASKVRPRTERLENQHSASEKSRAYFVPTPSANHGAASAVPGDSQQVTSVATRGIGASVSGGRTTRIPASSSGPLTLPGNIYLSNLFEFPWSLLVGQGPDADRRRQFDGEAAERRKFLGLPKLFWALVADAACMALFIMCIPSILHMAKRRRPLPLAG